MLISALFLLLFFHQLCLCFIPSSSAEAEALPGLDSFLARQYLVDPTAINDSFLSLPAVLKKRLGFRAHLLPPPATDLASLRLSVPVTVKLVGPTFRPSSPSILKSFLSSAISSDLFHVIFPFSSSSSQHLSLSHNLQVDVSLSSYALSTHISEVLKYHISNSSPPPRYTLAPVSYCIIDKIIREDFEKVKSQEEIYIYIIHLGSQSKPYAYSYNQERRACFVECLGSIWTGKERYLWIDLGAGPVDYGPSTKGEGSLLFAHGDGILPRGEFHPLSTMHGRPKLQKQLLADLASLVWSAYQVILVPSLIIPVPYESSLVIQFIHIHRTSPVDDGLDWKSIESTFTNGLDWKSIESTFMNEANNEGLLVGNQSLSFRKYKVNFSECSICAFAIWRATASYTHRYLHGGRSLLVEQYLDSKILYETISKSVNEFRRLSGVHDEDLGRVLPVYVFDLEVDDVMMLDLHHQTVAFKDMVIAVRTQQKFFNAEYDCNGHPIFTMSRELERPIVASILQSMWGVSPSHFFWSSSHNSTLVDYTWSVGQTPFGPFSEISSLSFAQKDAARRNVLLTSLNYTITRAIDVLQSIAAHGGEGKLLRDNQQKEYFKQRWHLFKYKLDKTISALSHFDFEMALYYIRSSQHDLHAIHLQFYHASQDLEASLVCFNDPPFPWASVCVSAGVLFTLFYVYVKREKLFVRKEKQF